jgi:RNA-binding protein
MLNARQRQYLKGLAHALEPVVRIGKAGLTPAVIEETRKSLQSHELIKVRIDGADDSAERREIAEALAGETGADVAATIGKLAVLYRAREEKPRIKMPK